MKHNCILKVGIIIAAIAFVTNSLQAQSWIGNNIITVNSNLSTDLEAQKVKPYGEHFLIGLSNVMGTDRYGFTVWEDGNGAIAMGYLHSVTTVVSDFVIFEDIVYFCGKDYSSGTDRGIIGRFHIHDLINNGGNFQYEITDIQATQHLTKLVAYKMDVDMNITHVVAIGNDGLSSTNPARLVCMGNATNPSFDYSVLRVMSLNGTEVFEDLTVDDKYVHTVSRIYYDNKFSVRCFLGHDPLDPLYYQDHYEFTLPAPAGLYYPIFDYTYPSHITMLQQGYLAVGVSG